MNIEKGRKYVVGFSGKTQDAVYSRFAWSSAYDRAGGILKMTYRQAKKHLKFLSGQNVEVAIFKLTPVYREKIKR